MGGQVILVLFFLSFQVPASSNEYYELFHAVLSLDHGRFVLGLL